MRFRLPSVFTCLILFFFVLTLFICPSKLNAADIRDMDSTANWNIRFDGPGVNSYLATGTIRTADIYGTGHQDIVVAAPMSTFNGNTSAGSIYIIAYSLYSQITGRGNIIDLGNPANYTLRIDGPPTIAPGLGAMGALTLKDIDGDGRADITTSSTRTSYNSRSKSGSVYVLYNSLIKQYTQSTTGNTMYLAHTDGDGNFDQFNLRFDGPTANSPVQGTTIASVGLGQYVGVGNFSQHDPDLVMAALYTGFNNFYAGSLYIISGPLLKTWTGVGNTIDLDNTSSSYSLRIDGSHAASARMGYYFSNAIGDLNNDGKDDLIAGTGSTTSSTGRVYILYNSLLSSHLATTGETLDLGDPSGTSYNIAITSGQNSDAFGGNGAYTITDLNQDGNKWLILGGALFAGHEGRTKNGSVYIIPYSLLSRYTGTGNSISLADSSNYYLRLDGAGNQHWLSDMFTTVQDHFGLDKKDILTGGPKIPSTDVNVYGPSDWGWIYVISNSIINNQPNLTGNILDMALSSSYSLLYQGAPTSAGATTGSHLTAPMTDDPVDIDLNNDGTHDSVFSAHLAAYTNGAGSGSLYVVYNFPHTITINSTYRHETRIDITGTITAPNSVTPIAGVEYQLDSNNPSGVWNSCTAIDGSFDSRTESFLCTTDSANTSDGGHSMNIRACDTDGSHTVKTSYANFGYVLGSVFDTSIQIPQLSQKLRWNLIATPIRDSLAENQGITVTVPPNTFNFNAYLFSKAVSVSDKKISLENSNFKLIGFVQDIWYKIIAFGHPMDKVRIERNLQNKPSIISLSYSNFDIKNLNPKNFRLVYSTDGNNWKTIPSSVVDTANKTVSALDEVGGYYAIGYKNSKTNLPGEISGDTTEKIALTAENTSPQKQSNETNKPESNLNLIQKIITFFKKLF